MKSEQAPTTLYDRTPPQNIEAERSVLGCMLLNAEAAAKAAEIIGAHSEHFYAQAHDHIYKALYAMTAHDRPIDLVTVVDRLQRTHRLEEVGGAAYVAELTTVVPTSANVEHYAQIVLEMARRRNIIESCTRAAMAAFSGDTESTDILDTAEHELGGIRQGNGTAEQVPIDTLVTDVIEHRARIVEGRVSPGRMLGLGAIDRVMQGMHPGDLCICAARPAVGKTALLMNAVHHVGVRQAAPVLVFSLEMSKEKLAERLLAIESLVCVSDVRRKEFQAEERLKRMAESSSAFQGKPITIVDKPALSVLDIRTHARQWARKVESPGLIGIDYIQLMRGVTDRRRVEQIEEVSRGLKTLAKELNVPILALAQLSRAAEEENSPFKMLNCMKGGGSIEEDADKCLILHSVGYPGKDDEIPYDPAHTIGWCVAKHRDGNVGRGKMNFDKPTQRIRELSAVEEPEEPPQETDEIPF